MGKQRSPVSATPRANQWHPKMNPDGPLRQAVDLGGVHASTTPLTCTDYGTSDS